MGPYILVGTHSRKVQCDLEIIDKEEQERNFINGIKLPRLEGFRKSFDARREREQRCA